SFNQSVVSIFNPAAVLTILQAVSFLDASAFELEISLFGIIGEGIAQSLDQCEDAEGCAPTVTLDELDQFIVEIKRRIEFLDQEVAANAIDPTQGQDLKNRLQAELDNFEQYRVQLVAYNARIEAEEFGDDAGFDFDDVFEAEEVLEPVEVEPVEEIPDFEPIERPADIEAEIPTDEFEDIDEALETLEEPAAVETTPEVTPEPETIDLDEEPVFDDSDFEEFEEELDDSLTNDLMKRDRVNEFAGAVRLDRFGNVEWQGAVVLPTLHRRF
ncbi:MAG: hypothetical protein O7G83_09270, partial [Proteobacteria bacterium]|nr:hypothetical protein [Pseudomonadota bacterium]